MQGLQSSAGHTAGVHYQQFLVPPPHLAQSRVLTHLGTTCSPNLICAHGLRGSHLELTTSCPRPRRLSYMQPTDLSSQTAAIFCPYSVPTPPRQLFGWGRSDLTQQGLPQPCATL